MQEFFCFFDTLICAIFVLVLFVCVIGDAGVCTRTQSSHCLHSANYTFVIIAGFFIIPSPSGSNAKLQLGAVQLPQLASDKNNTQFIHSF